MDPALFFVFVFLVFLVVAILFAGLVTIQQGTIGVTTIFGKYKRQLRPGLNLVIPFIERVVKRISIQNQASEMEFQAITADQANVYFKAMILYSVLNQEEETIKNVAFKFIDNRSFMQALTRTVEGSIRSFVGSKRQSEILSLRREIINHVKDQLDGTLESWGFHLIDLQMNDITFDTAIIESMARVVASNNLRAAAENEGQALLITKTKAAEAEGNSIKIAAEAERVAAQMRGQGVALFRQEVAKGMTNAARELQGANMDTSMILFSMWTEALKNFAEQGKGNVIFLDGSPDNLNRTMKQMMAMMSLEDFSNHDTHKNP